MPSSSRFAIAVHVLTLMAERGDAPLKSEMVACSVNTNPVVIRRIVCSLQRAQIVTSQTGAAGGSKLARAPREITLLEVYKAVEGGRLLALHRQRPDRHCSVGMNIESVFSVILREAEEAFEQVLANLTVEKVLRAVKTCGARRKSYRRAIR